MPVLAWLRCIRTLAVLDSMSTVSMHRCICNLAVLDNTSKVLLLKGICDGHSPKVSCPDATVCCYALVEKVTGQKTCGMCVKNCQYCKCLGSHRCTVVS